MPERPYTLLSCAMSIDGYLDEASGPRLILSNDADLDRVDEVRASCDAILVGAATVRSDNPRLLVRAPDRRARRVADGLGPTPVKVTVTESGKLDPAASFFAADDSDKLVYCPTSSAAEATAQLASVATVIDGGQTVEMRSVCEDLYSRGVRRLMVEGGQGVLTQFLTAGIADELQLVVAPFFVGSSHAPRLVHEGRFPWNASHPARLAAVCRIGEVVLLTYALSARFTQT